MKAEKIQIENIPAILYGAESDKLYISIHGKHSRKEEAENFANIAAEHGYQVISFDLPEHGDRVNEPYECTVQNGVHDLNTIYSFVQDRYKSFSLYACSLGAYFSLTAYRDISFERSLFLSPILNMERLIRNMMTWADVSEEELKQKGEIQTSFGEKLSWNYYQYVKEHPIDKWNNRTFILYGANDNLTERTVLNSFSEKFNCDVTIMDNGEHYFHTPEQLDYLDSWIRRAVK